MSTNIFINAENDNQRLDERFRLDFPTRMNDGRQLTDYRSSCLYNLAEQDMTTYQYRLFLKHNSDKIAQNYSTINNYISNPGWEDTNCKTCSDYSISSSYLPLTCDGNDCLSQIDKSAGVGDYFVNNH
jgi:hypothetical protein